MNNEEDIVNINGENNEGNDFDNDECSFQFNLGEEINGSGN